MVWLMLAIPAATVVAGIATMRIARTDGALDAAPESVARVAQAQVADTAADERAAALGLAANARLDGAGRWIVEGATNGQRLSLVHPTLARADLHWTRSGDAWLGPPLPAGARGRLVLEGDDWRLVGRWPGDAGHAALHPSVPAP
jgi:hypothetical protein